jgi:hypothetical protein
MGYAVRTSLSPVTEAAALRGYPIRMTLSPVGEAGGGIVPPITLVGGAFATWAAEQARLAKAEATASTLAAFPGAADAGPIETLLLLESDAVASVARRLALLEAFPLAAKLSLRGIIAALEIGAKISLDPVLMGAPAVALILAVFEQHDLRAADGGTTTIEFRYRWGN